MQPDNSNNIAVTPSPSGEGSAPMVRGVGSDCFICGSKRGLREIKRWKQVSRAVKLITDYVCTSCFTKHNIKSSHANHENR